MTSYKHAVVDSNRIFYREAGVKIAPTTLLLHGFPTSSHMFRNLNNAAPVVVCSCA
jgi:pimeloyl-ACP methyl ester carboxylesterase